MSTIYYFNYFRVTGPLKPIMEPGFRIVLYFCTPRKCKRLFDAGTKYNQHR